VTAAAAAGEAGEGHVRIFRLSSETKFDRMKEVVRMVVLVE
jgi:hypothetical protein